MGEFNKKVGKQIPKDEADKLIKRWKEKKHKTNSSFFGADIISSLLSKPGATGIRIHYGLDDQGNMQPVLTPEYDETTLTAQTQDEDPGTYADSSLGCPPYCPK